MSAAILHKTCLIFFVELFYFNFFVVLLFCYRSQHYLPNDEYMFDAFAHFAGLIRAIPGLRNSGRNKKEIVQQAGTLISKEMFKTPKTTRNLSCRVMSPKSDTEVCKLND